MRYKTSKKIRANLEATLDNGQRVVLNGDVEDKKEFFPVNEVDEKVNLMGLFKAISEVCKSSKDIEVLGYLIEYANAMNEILISSQTELAKDIGISRKQLSVLLKRAEEVNLFHKLGTGRYLLNPYKVLSESASKRSYEHQELIQVMWKEETGLITELEMKKLQLLSKHLELNVGLRPTTFNLSVAEYYASKGEITDKQRETLLK